MKWFRPGKKHAFSAAALYGLLILGPLLAINAALDYRNTRPSDFPLADDLRVKTRHYRDHAAGYNLIFLGDSRTYCNIHPFRIDPLLGTSSANLGMWGHYFATQYGQVRDIADALPPDTVVVWSVGHRNFQPVGDHLWAQIFPAAQKKAFSRENGRWWVDRYPVGWTAAPRLFGWGYPAGAVWNNLSRFGPAGALLAEAGKTRQYLYRQRNNPIAVFSLPPLARALETGRSADSTIAGERGIAQLTTAQEKVLEASPLTASDIARVEVMRRGDLDTSLVVQTARGSYYRIELEPEFFREEQRKLARRIAEMRTEPPPDARFTPALPLWRNFIGLLDFFRAHNVRLVLNVVEEAPWVYEAWGGRQELRRFMEETVRPEVEGRGFGWVCVDYDRFSNRDYFDFDHFNSAGAEKYTLMLADTLRPWFGEKN
jgi:hypothetical protein